MRLKVQWQEGLGQLREDLPGTRAIPGWASKSISGSAVLGSARVRVSSTSDWLISCIPLPPTSTFVVNYGFSKARVNIGHTRRRRNDFQRMSFEVSVEIGRARHEYQSKCERELKRSWERSRLYWHKAKASSVTWPGTDGKWGRNQGPVRAVNVSTLTDSRQNSPLSQRQPTDLGDFGG
jgi:hypothetical protein